MATQVIMPALEMAQTTGKLVHWLKREGETVTKGEPLIEVETDKVTVEIESSASGVLRGIIAHEGDVIPVGQTIGWLLEKDEAIPTSTPQIQSGRVQPKTEVEVSASPVARKMIEENGLTLAQVKPQGGRVEKNDVVNYLASRAQPSNGRILASPKARRLAAERNLDLALVRGSGPNGAILTADLPTTTSAPSSNLQAPTSNMWRVMADRMTVNWNTAPHFYLKSEANASRLLAWRAQAQKETSIKITVTDLLIKIVGVALSKHPRVNVSWINNELVAHHEINVGLAVAVEEGLVVPVIAGADRLNLKEIAAQRDDLVTRAQAGKLRLEELKGGTFTISNLGMYAVDEFQAILNSPQAAILAVGRIAERVVPLNGQPSIQPRVNLTLSCDHRAIDGARGAQFLGTLVELFEEPLRLLN